MLLIVGESQLELESLTVRGMDSKWWTLGDLNPRPPGCKPGALPS